jgi:hypothetical protein
MIMLALMRDHVMQEMMVALSRGVECSAKIAMTVLRSRHAATRLLLKL